MVSLSALWVGGVLGGGGHSVGAGVAVSGGWCSYGTASGLGGRVRGGIRSGGGLGAFKCGMGSDFLL